MNERDNESGFHEDSRSAEAIGRLSRAWPDWCAASLCALAASVPRLIVGSATAHPARDAVRLSTLAGTSRASPTWRLPVALAACDNTHLLSFYPARRLLSELAAIRWAAEHKVPVIPRGLGLAAHGGGWKCPASIRNRGWRDRPRWGVLLDRYAARAIAWRSSGEKLVETPACQSTPEAIRRARRQLWLDGPSFPPHGPTPADRHREAAIAAGRGNARCKSVAVIGLAFMPLALLPEPALWSPPTPDRTGRPRGRLQKARDLARSLFLRLGSIEPQWLSGRRRGPNAEYWLLAPSTCSRRPIPRDRR